MNKMDNKNFVTITVWLFHLTWKAEAYYCDNDKCDFDEYCCGHNICCTSYNVWQMWYFWLGLVIFLILLAGCFSFWRYRYQQALIVQSCELEGYNQLYNEADQNMTTVEAGLGRHDRSPRRDRHSRERPSAPRPSSGGKNTLKDHFLGPS